jgi:phage tail protein X
MSDSLAWRMSDVTRIIEAIQQGNPRAADEGLC